MTPELEVICSMSTFTLCRLHGTHLQVNFQATADGAENSRQVIHARIAFGRQHAVQTLAGQVGQFRKLLEAECCVNEVAKNETCRFRFISKKQRRRLIQQRLRKRWIALNPRNDGFLESPE